MDTNTLQKPAATAQGVARIQGRIVGARTANLQGTKKRLTVLRFAASDPYAYPATVEVQSIRDLGAVGDEITCLVRVGGYGRSYDSEDPRTGEKVKVQTATNTLEVCEG